MRDWHEHGPQEACVSDCPEPHMNEEEAKDWYERLMSCVRPEQYIKIMNEGGTKPKFLSGRA